MGIKVLVIDDSPFYRTLLKKGIEQDNEINVISTAVDAYDAIDKIIKFRPDIITCDIEMPKIDGVSLIKQLIPQYPIPIVVVSSISSRIFDAVKAGAVDFILKTDFENKEKFDLFFSELNLKIKLAFSKGYHKKLNTTNPVPLDRKRIFHKQVIAIGASTGGTEAIFSILKNLPANVPPIVIVQHIPVEFSKLFADRLNRDTSFTVSEARMGDKLLFGHVYVAPGDKHLEVKIDLSGKPYLSVNGGNKINGHCPSIDKLFYSVAKTFGDKSIGVLLTGMGSDGALSLGVMKRKGATTIIQDESTCVVYGMPKSAKAIGAETFELALEKIPSSIVQSL